MRMRRRPRRRGSVRRQILCSIIIGIVLGSLIIHLFNTFFRPTAITVVSDHLSNQISGQICEVVNTVLADEGITYDTICTVQYDAQGNFAALQTDMARLVLLQITITTNVAQEFDNSLVSEKIYVPLGSLLPGLLFSGLGPELTVEVLTVGNISAQFDNEFFDQGINQTLHRVVLTVTAELSLLLPGGVYTYTDETKVVLAETVLMGQVPDSYSSFGQFDSVKDAYDAYYHFGTNEE